MRLLTDHLRGFDDLLLLSVREKDARLCNGAPYDVLERGDELSRAMLTGNTNDISYDVAAVDDFTNCLTLVFTEKQWEGSAET